VSVKEQRERAIIVALNLSEREDWDIDERLDELEELLASAGADTVARVVQQREVPDSTYVVGRGKVAEIEQIREAEKADIVVFDTQMSPAQRRNLEREIDARVVDRTQVILDIFAQRARTKEGKLQVMLAQMTYALTQLVGTGTELSRLGGGIGTRGPGETKLETDRRVIRQRIQDLKHEIESVRRHRAFGRTERQETPVVVAALVGYTNAGKSTLLNRLTGAHVDAEDNLFATLDPTTRRTRLPSGQEVLFTDTVGFIRDLPPQLVAAFRATLEEVTEADLIVHVVDGSHTSAEKHVRVVEQVLSDIGAADKPSVLAVNKSDRGLLFNTSNSRENVVFISALTGERLHTLLDAIDQLISSGREKVCLKVPYDMQNILPLLHRHGRVVSTEYCQDDVRICAEINSVWANRFRRWIQRRNEEH